MKHPNKKSIVSAVNTHTVLRYSCWRYNFLKYLFLLIIQDYLYKEHWWDILPTDKSTSMIPSYLKNNKSWTLSTISTNNRTGWVILILPRNKYILTTWLYLLIISIPSHRLLDIIRCWFLLDVVIVIPLWMIYINMSSSIWY